MTTWKHLLSMGKTPGEGHFLLAEGDSELKVGDEVVILLHSKHLPEITERWNVRSQPS